MLSSFWRSSGDSRNHLSSALVEHWRCGLGSSYGNGPSLRLQPVLGGRAVSEALVMDVVAKAYSSCTRQKCFHVALAGFTLTGSTAFVTTGLQHLQASFATAPRPMQQVPGRCKEQRSTYSPGLFELQTLCSGGVRTTTYIQALL